MEKTRCRWCNMNNPLYIEYHDREWGMPNFEEGYLFEMLILESFQAGLSWECVLNKRESFRTEFDGFDPAKIACYDQAKINELMCNPNIIRNRRKIEAAVNNSRVFMAIARQWGSFGSYLESFTHCKTVYECGNTTNALSDALSKDLKKRGMKFAGSTIIYSYLQAIGVIYSHDKDCYLYKGE